MALGERSQICLLGGGLELRLGSQAFLFSILVMQFITSVTHEDYFNGTKLHILHLKKS